MINTDDTTTTTPDSGSPRPMAGRPERDRDGRGSAAAAQRRRPAPGRILRRPPRRRTGLPQHTRAGSRTHQRLVRAARPGALPALAPDARRLRPGGGHLFGVRLDGQPRRAIRAAARGGVATGLNTMVRTVGGACGSAIATAVLAAASSTGAPSAEGVHRGFRHCFSRRGAHDHHSPRGASPTRQLTVAHDSPSCRGCAPHGLGRTHDVTTEPQPGATSTAVRRTATPARLRPAGRRRLRRRLRRRWRRRWRRGRRTTTAAGWAPPAGVRAQLPWRGAKRIPRMLAVRWPTSVSAVNSASGPSRST